MVRPSAGTGEPLTQSIVVECPLEHAFESFVGSIGEWWPLQPYSLGQADVVEVTFPPTLGAEVFESRSDGSTATWGTVTRWQPPDGFGLRWQVFSTPSDVDVEFTAVGPSHTRVEVVHSGWQAIAHSELAEVAALQASYSQGWRAVLSAFAGHVAADPADGLHDRHS